MLSSAEVAKLLPGATRTWMGGRLLAERRPGRAAESRAGNCRSAPAAAAPRSSPIAPCAASRRSGGRVSGVVTEKGRIACDSRRARWRRLVAPVLRQSRHRIPAAQGARLGDAHRAASRACRCRRSRARDSPSGGGSTAATPSPTAAPRRRDRARQLPPVLQVHAGAAAPVERSAAAPRRAILRRADDAPALGARRATRRSSRFASSTRRPIEALLEEARRQRSPRHFPAFANVRIVESWAGLIDVTPDVVPVIGPVPSVPGFYLASGFSGHGFGIGPAAGRLMADIVTGDTPIVDPEAAPLRALHRRLATHRSTESAPKEDRHAHARSDLAHHCSLRSSR